MASQRQHSATRPSVMTKNNEGVWFKNDCVWLPAEDSEIHLGESYGEYAYLLVMKDDVTHCTLRRADKCSNSSSNHGLVQ